MWSLINRSESDWALDYTACLSPQSVWAAHRFCPSGGWLQECQVFGMCHQPREPEMEQAAEPRGDEKASSKSSLQEPSDSKGTPRADCRKGGSQRQALCPSGRTGRAGTLCFSHWHTGMADWVLEHTQLRQPPGMRLHTQRACHILETTITRSHTIPCAPYKHHPRHQHRAIMSKEA